MRFEFEPEPERLVVRTGRYNWVWGLVGLVLGVIGYVIPLLFLTPLAGILVSGTGLSRYNRLRRYGAGGRVIALIGLVVSVISFANILFGFTQLIRVSAQFSQLLGNR